MTNRTTAARVGLPEPVGGYDSLPQVRTFESIGEEREHRKTQLATAFRLLSRYGLAEGVAGHITVRDPEVPSHLWVNPYGMHFSKMRVSDLVRISDDGQIVDGNGPVNQAAFAIHVGVHSEASTAVAVAHSHTVFGRAMCALRMELTPITQEHCIFYDDHIRYDGSVVVLDVDEGREIARRLDGRRAALLSNHGLLTLGESVESCVWRFLTLERCCQVHLAAAAAGPVVALSDEEARAIHSVVGTEYACWFAVRALFEKVLAEEPELAS